MPLVKKKTPPIAIIAIPDQRNLPVFSYLNERDKRHAGYGEKPEPKR